MLVNDLKAENCEQTVASIQEFGRKAVIAEGDISSEINVRGIIETGIKNFGRIDILVNNAGVVGRKSIFDTNEKDWDRMIDVNLKGTFLCSKYVAERMKEQGVKGRIVNISSIMGEVALPPRDLLCE